MTAPTNSLVFTSQQRSTAAALFSTLFPADEIHPGAIDIGVLDYVENLLTGYGQDLQENYWQGLDCLQTAAEGKFGKSFADCGHDEQQELVNLLEKGELDTCNPGQQREFMEMAVAHMQEGLFADPLYGGNRDKKGWKFLRHPGVWFENSQAEMMSEVPEDKGGNYRSIQDLEDFIQDRPDGSAAIPPDFDADRGMEPPQGEADVVLIGLGAINSVIAPQLTEAGLRVVALEAGPYRSRLDYKPDELGQSFYGRAKLGPKFNQETPRWRLNEGEPTRPCSFSLGRMLNGVGGSVFHYGGWMRRFHPHHFRTRAHIQDMGWEHLLPRNSTLADWPVSYDDLEPYYTSLEWEIGISGVSDQPPVPRSRELPMPPLAPYRMGEIFRGAAEELGLHPYPVPAGVNSQPYGGRPASKYSCWTCGFGTFDDSLWHPAAECVPKALATGHLDLKTKCRVTEILTDDLGHVKGVRYRDAAGKFQVQLSRCVILGAYIWENLRLMFLSGNSKSPAGLGNSYGQLGRNVMTKMFSQVLAQFPDTYFNSHCANASQSMIVEDSLYPDFPADECGFLGGATISAEPQFLPLNIGRETLPPEVPPWGHKYKEHLQTWQQWGVLRMQPDTLSYTNNFVDLDPHHRDRSGLGMPVIRITYDLRENEHRLLAWAEDKCEEILKTMGGQNPWRGPRLTGVGSCHDVGGIRMGTDPSLSVVDPNLEVHDTPGLFVFSGGVFPSCPGINPTLTMMALCRRACEDLIGRLQRNGV